MKLFILIACVGAIFCSDLYTIEDIRELADVLEGDLARLNYNMSSSLTDGNVIDENTIHITDFIQPTIQLHNIQQDQRIRSYDRQVKEIEHKVDSLKYDVTEATTQANATVDKLAELRAELDSLPDHTSAIDALDTAFDNLKDAILNSLDSSVTDLRKNNSAVYDYLDSMKDFVKSRNCETGTGSFSPYTEVQVTFKTNFKTAPTVSMAITGFKSHLDLHSYEEYDGISLVKTFDPSSVTTEGFTVKIEDESQGMVVVKAVDCSWMACANLEDSFDTIH